MSIFTCIRRPSEEAFGQEPNELILRDHGLFAPGKFYEKNTLASRDNTKYNGLADRHTRIGINWDKWYTAGSHRRYRGE